MLTKDNKKTNDEMNKNAGRKERNFYKCFTNTKISELQAHIVSAQSREEKAFYRALLNLKLQLNQEKVVGKDLV